MPQGASAPLSASTGKTFAAETGCWEIAERIHREYGAHIRCIVCKFEPPPTISAFIKDEGGKPPKDGGARRQWRCRNARKYRVEHSGEKPGCGVKSNLAYIRLALRTISARKVERIRLEVLGKRQARNEPCDRIAQPFTAFPTASPPTSPALAPVQAPVFYDSDFDDSGEEIVVAPRPAPAKATPGEDAPGPAPPVPVLESKEVPNPSASLPPTTRGCNGAEPLPGSRKRPREAALESLPSAKRLCTAVHAVPDDDRELFDICDQIRLALHALEAHLGLRRRRIFARDALIPDSQDSADLLVSRSTIPKRKRERFADSISEDDTFDPNSPRTYAKILPTPLPALADSSAARHLVPPPKSQGRRRILFP